MPGHNLDPRQNLDPKSSPKALLGKHLRRLRLAAGFTTQAAAAARIDGYGEDSLSKAETGAQIPTDDLYTRLLDLYGATDLDRVYLDDLLAQARQDKGSGLDWFEPWLKIEKLAQFLRIWCPLLIPGVLQVEEYALPLFLAMGKTQGKAAELLDLRLGRREILERPDPVTMVVLLAESVLYAAVSTPAVMVKQFTHMLEVSEAPNVTIQIVRSEAALAGLFGAFDIASGAEIPDTMRVSAVQDQTTNDSALVLEAIMIFELIRSRALNAEESRRIIVEARQQWQNRQ